MTAIHFEPSAICEPVVFDLRHSEQRYSSRNWDYEKTTRYLIRLDNRILEASLFQHLKDGRHVKSVIELPTSYGCPMACAYCASGAIENTQQLNSEQLEQLYALISGIYSCDPDVVSLAGIGESSLNQKNVIEFGKMMFAKRPKIALMMTTVGIKPSFLLELDRLSSLMNIKVVQVTIFHHNDEMTRMVHGDSFERYSLDGVICAIQRTRHIKIRLNYVLIKDVNDSHESVDSLISKLEPIKHICTIRISKLNETAISRRSNLAPTSEKMVTRVSHLFRSHGFDAYPFYSSFNDNMNCGQLAWQHYGNDSRRRSPKIV